MKTTYPFSPVFQNDMFSDIQRTTKIGDFLEKNSIWPSENNVFRLFNWEFEYEFVHIAQNQKLGYHYDKIRDFFVYFAPNSGQNFGLTQPNFGLTQGNFGLTEENFSPNSALRPTLGNI